MLRFSPNFRFAYDDNINGGVPADTVQVGGLEFVVDQEVRAKSGLVVELSSSAQVYINPSDDLQLIVSATAIGRYSYEHEIGRTDLIVQACGRSHLQRWRFLDLCARASKTERQLSDEDKRSASATFSTIWDQGLANSELSFSVERELERKNDRTLGRVSWQSVHPRLGAFSLDFAVGERPDGYNAFVRSAGLRYGAFIGGEFTSVSLGISEEAGSSFFGQERRDNVVQIEFARQFGRTRAQLGYRIRDSTIDGFSSDSVIAAVQVRW